jgi:hypothetical protein
MLSPARVWTLFAGAALAVLVMASVAWSHAHPYGISWDESEYFNLAAGDTSALHAQGLGGWREQILYADGGRPPAYRILAMPVFFLFGFSVRAGRLVAIGVSMVSFLLVYLTARRLVPPETAAFTVLLLALSPEVLFASSFFSTEYPLYLATAAMLYVIIGAWDRERATLGGTLGLGLALGVGLLAKSSFVLIAGPLLAVALIAPRVSAIKGPGPAWLLKGTALGVALALPWWWRNAAQAAAFTESARNFVRHSMGPPSLVTNLIWLGAWFQCMLGFGLGLVVVLVGIVAVRRAAGRGGLGFTPVQRLTLAACAGAVVPLIGAQLVGTNHLLRHVSPTMFPFALAVGILADRTDWARARASLLASGALFTLQLAAIVAPVVVPNSTMVDQARLGGRPPWRVFTRFDQWDWRPLLEVSRIRGLGHPSISYLGSAGAFNASQITYPWRIAGDATGGVTWLWRYEQGPIDWNAVMATADRCDLVVTAPGYVGLLSDKQDLDNQHNAEFVERLGQDAHFTGPIRLVMGRFERVEVVVFVRKGTPHG